MVKQTIRIGLVSLLAAALLLGVSAVVRADSGDNAKPVAVVDITIKDDLKLDIAASGPCQVNVRQEGSNTEGMFPSPYRITYGDSIYNGDPEAVVSIAVRDDLVHIATNGPCELNVRVDGPWEVHIDVDDEVRLSVEASDESQVFIDDEKLDEPLKLDDQESGDIDEHSSRLDDLAIISGAFLAVGLPCFFLIRRKAQNKVNNEGR